MCQSQTRLSEGEGVHKVAGTADAAGFTEGSPTAEVMEVMGVFLRASSRKGGTASLHINLLVSSGNRSEAAHPVARTLRIC